VFLSMEPTKMLESRELNGLLLLSSFKSYLEKKERRTYFPPKTTKQVIQRFNDNRCRNELKRMKVSKSD